MKKISALLVSVMLVVGISTLAGCSFNKAYTPKPAEQKVDNSLLHTPGTLRVGVDTSNAPYAAESQGSIVGIDVDVAAALADKLGLKLELVDIGSSADQAFSSENVDIVMGVGSDSQNCWVSKPYLSSSIVLFSALEGAQIPKDSESYTVAAQASSMSAFEVGSRLGENRLDAASDIQTAFDHLKSGQAQYVATDSTIGAYVAHTNGMQLYPVALLAEETNYCIGAPATATGLQNAVTEALQALSDGGVISVIEKKWLGTQTDLSSLTIIQPLPESAPAEGGEGSENADGNAEGGAGGNANSSSGSSSSSGSNSSKPSSSSGSGSGSSSTSNSSSSDSTD